MDNRSAAEREVTYELACPICFTSKLIVVKGSYSQRSSLTCSLCNRTFADAGAYVNLTLTSGVSRDVYTTYNSPIENLFRTSLVSYLYERGWRQRFANAGFPGPDVETEMALQYLTPAFGQTLVDLSCGSGLLTRRFIKSGRFRSVIGMDFSEGMLQQTQQYIADDKHIHNSDCCLVQADVSRLPFRSGSVSAIHAGAAIHCWPTPQLGVAEISRVLRPGGVFVASTFMSPLAPLEGVWGEAPVRPALQFVDRLLSLPRNWGGGHRWWAERELRDVCSNVGLGNFQRQRNMWFVMFAVQKPEVAPSH